MFTDPQFWVAIAFIIFVAAVFKPVRKMLISNLDSQIKTIKNNIEQAENLKNETQITLSDIKKRQNEVQYEIKNLHKEAKEKISFLESQAQNKLKEQISKREVLASAKIVQITRDANVFIQQHISQTVVRATVALLEKKLNHEEKQNLINQSIKELRSVIKN